MSSIPNEKKEQRRQYNRDYAARNKERISAQRRTYRASNKEAIRAQQKAWRDANPTKVKDLTLLKDFGLTLEEYKTLSAAQSHACAICLRPQSELTRALAVDHDHTTGQIRGLLCSNCNTGIGNLRDDLELLSRASAYLASWKQDAS